MPLDTLTNDALDLDAYIRAETDARRWDAATQRYIPADDLNNSVDVDTQSA